MLRHRARRWPPRDTDAQFDVYERDRRRDALRVRGWQRCLRRRSRWAASADGAKVFFETDELLDPLDDDTSRDVYENDGTVRVLSIGPAGGTAASMRSSPAPLGRRARAVRDRGVDGRRGHGRDVDVYDSAAGATILDRAAGGNGAFDARFRGCLGRRFADFFTTESRSWQRTPTRASTCTSAQPGVTTLLSTGPAGGNGAFDARSPANRATAAPSSFDQRTAGERATPTPPPTSTRARDTAGYARPKGATPMRVALVPAYDGLHVAEPPARPAARVPLVRAPASNLGDLTVGTPDANGSRGRLHRLAAARRPVGNPATEADEADVGVSMSISDVRRTSDLADYTGELRGRALAADHGPGQRRRRARLRDRDGHPVQLRRAVRGDGRRRGSHLPTADDLRRAHAGRGGGGRPGDMGARPGRGARRGRRRNCRERAKLRVRPPGRHSFREACVAGLSGLQVGRSPSIFIP